MNTNTILLALIISLLLLHEMDAIRTKEWKMFIILKDMTDETAYKIFLFAHLPLYFLVIFLILHNNSNILLPIIIDIFLIGHAIVHFCFRKKENNGFTSLYSKIIIYALGMLAVIHLYLQFS